MELDSVTFAFLVELKAKNLLWFTMLEKMGVQGAKSAQAGLEECERVLQPLGIKTKDINPFTLSKAARDGEFQRISSIVQSSAWELYRNRLVKRLSDDPFN